MASKVEKEDPPYDMSTTIGDRLKPVPNHRDEFEKGFQWLLSKAGEISEHKAYYLSKAGIYAAFLGKLDEAERYLREASIQQQRSSQERPGLVTQIRLATVLHWKSQYSEAESIFLGLVPLCEEKHPQLVDFVFQHLGKMRLDQGRVQEAREHFERALRIRLEKGDEELILSTRQALAAIENHHSI